MGTDANRAALETYEAEAVTSPTQLESSSNPTVTIAIPTRNRVSFLRQSLASAIGQTYPHLEILIGDNASNDATPEVVRDLVRRDARVKYHRHDSDLGMAGNWNFLLERATGSFFLLLSDDDCLTPDAVAVLVAACKVPQVRFAYAPAIVIDEHGIVIDRFFQPAPAVEAGATFIKTHLEGHRIVCLAAMLVRIGPPHERFYYSIDVGPVCDFLNRLTLATTGLVAFVDRPTAFYRAHSSNETLRVVEFTSSLLSLLDQPSTQAGVLAPFRSSLLSYVSRQVREQVLSAAVRGRAVQARAVLPLLIARRMDTDGLSTQLTLASFRGIRALARLRRKWLELRAAVWAKQLKVAPIDCGEVPPAAVAERTSHN